MRRLTTVKPPSLRVRHDFNITKQERLGQIYAEGLLAIEAYKNSIFPLKKEETDLRDQITKFELNLIQKERSEEYLELIKALLEKNIFDSNKKKIDILERRNLMKVMFKYIKVEDGKLTDFELYQPFKSLYKGAPISCQMKENQQVTEKDRCVVSLLPTAGRWMRYRRTMERIAEALFRTKI